MVVVSCYSREGGRRERKRSEERERGEERLEGEIERDQKACTSTSIASVKRFFIVFNFQDLSTNTTKNKYICKR